LLPINAPPKMIPSPRPFATTLLALSLMSAPLASSLAATPAATQRYAFYDPKIEEHYLYQDQADSPYAYGHMVSIEHFDGHFHAVWNNSHGGHATRYFKEKGRPQPFQRLLWQTST